MMLTRVENKLQNHARFLFFLCMLLLLASTASLVQTDKVLVLSSHQESSDQQETTEEVDDRVFVEVYDAHTLEETGENHHVGIRVELSQAATTTVTANYFTEDGTADNSSDYKAATGTVTFQPGVTTTIVQVEIVADDHQEADERFYVEITDANGAEIADSRGGITILDDDGSNEGRTLSDQDEEAISHRDERPPTIHVSTPKDLVASSGWYNKMSSGVDGVRVSVTASDDSGVRSIKCFENATEVFSARSEGHFNLRDGIHQIECVATDSEGNKGASQDSTPMPITFKVDQTPPLLTCPEKPSFFLREPEVTISARLVDQTSGPSSGTASSRAITTSVGQDQSATIEGVDLADNKSFIDCLYDVVYRFSGFESPIRSGEHQETQSGRTIPIKWRISDYFDVGIAERGSYLSVTTFSDSCGTDRADELQESSPGASDLKYEADGRWHFNWKTSKSYSGKCKTISLNLLDGVTDRLAYFQFR